MKGSLYQRLGGADGIAAAVDDALDRHAANPALTALLGGKDLPQLKARAADWLSGVAGGPPQDDASTPQPWRGGEGLDFAQVLAVAADLNDALRERGVGADDIVEVVDLVRCTGAQRWIAAWP